MKLFEKRFRYSPEDLNMVVPRPVRWVCDGSGPALMGFVLLGPFVDIAKQDLPMGIAAGGVVGFVVLVGGFFLFQMMQKLWFRQLFLQGEVAFAVDESSLSIRNHQTQFQISRESLRTVVAKKYWWVFCFSAGRWIVLPRCLLSDEEVGTLHKMLPHFNHGKGQAPDRAFLARQRLLRIQMVAPGLLLLCLMLWAFWRSGLL